MRNDSDYPQLRDACRRALEAIAPCVVGWDEGTMPTWARKLEEVVPVLQQALGIKPVVWCSKCDGCGQVADTDDQEPWTAWTRLPLQSAAAVVAGIVRPIPCPVCKGSGRQAPEPPEEGR